MGGRGSASKREGASTAIGQSTTVGRQTERNLGQMEREGATSQDLRQFLEDRNASVRRQIREERGRDTRSDAERRSAAISLLRRGRIEYDDDLVEVISPSGRVDYRGLHDYNPYKDDDWTYDEAAGHYVLEGPGGTYVMGKM